MGGKGRLRDYHGKRHFDRTAEPRGDGREAREERDALPRFVVQIHDARRMHFDFRLQVTILTGTICGLSPGISRRPSPGPI